MRLSAHVLERTCALCSLPALNRRLIERDPDPWGSGQRQHTVLRAQARRWRYEAFEIVDILLQHKVFHSETVGHGSHQMHVQIGMSVGCHGEVKRGSGVRYLEPLSDATQDAGIRL